jgi:hypothetical protein
VTSPIVRQEVSVVVAADDHKPESGALTLDALAIPYGRATFDLPLNADTALEDFDPRDDVRALVTASEATSATSRTFDLGIRSRSVDYVAKTVSLECATDEALLQDYATLTTDEGARAEEGSLRGVVDYVLARIGASLAPGPWDADVTARWTLTNLSMKPRTQATTGFGTGLNANFIGMDSTSGAFVGSAYPYWRANTPGETYITDTDPLPVSEGSTFTASVRFNSEQPNRAMRLIIHWLNDAGTFIEDEVGPDVIATTQPVWTVASVTGTVPRNRGITKMRLVYDATAQINGEAFGLSGIVITTGPEVVPYFDGNGSIPADANYTYSWTGAAGASQSERSALVDRPPELFTWKPGTTAWDFLSPLLSTAGLRLFCDELRVWRLIDPAAYTVDGFVRLSAFNVVTATDTISREDPDVFATGVVIRYAWQDVDNVGQIAYDTAGTPEKVAVIDYARTFPGPGAAAAVLARRSGTGRTQDVDALTLWDTTPGADASISLPDAPEQQGKVSSVRFSMGDDAVMSVGTRGLIDIPPGSWLAWDPEQTWVEVPAGVTWISLP